LFALGQTQLAQRDHSAAAASLDGVLREKLSDSVRGQALVWRGRVAEAAGDPAAAAARYQEAVPLLPEIEGYLRVRSADALATIHDYAAAIGQLDAAAVAAASTPALKSAIDEKLADITGKAGDAAESARRYRDLLERMQNPWERSGLQFRLAQALQNAGDTAGARTLLLDIVARYPSAGYAGEAMRILDLHPGEISDLTAGMVLYYHRDNDAAKAALERVAADPLADQGRALFYLGLLDERTDRNLEAIARYDELLRLAPFHALAEDAAWQRARLFESMGSLPNAIAAYAELRTAHPQGQQFNDAAFREGLARYKLGDFGGAALVWGQAADGAAAAIRVRNLFWMGKALQQTGERDAANDVWQKSAALRPASYYGLRSQAMLAGGGPPVPTSVGPLPAPADSAAEERQFAAWLAGLTTTQPLRTPDEVRSTLMSDAHLQRGDLLLSLGLRSQAMQEYRETLNGYRRDPAALTALIRLFRERDVHQLAALAGYALIDRSGQGTAQAPAWLLRVVNPAPYADLVNQEAPPRGVDPLLLLALVQQESGFDAGAVSVVEALGLTQVMPSTGRALAQQMRLSDFEPEDLLQPSVSLRIGSAYLAEQLRHFGGDAAKALAAYNAGPAAADLWAQRSQGDADVFVEEIDYDQTASYVRSIAENMARYRSLYRIP
ncbi:MAG: transglycosylase SLT domain-containing protein, partial [Chloroflexi bacterium]|nr:transglycosylase SLT domain-containing protein [Chloroflexota bacterium]